MKKLFKAFLLLALSILCMAFVGCTDEEPTPSGDVVTEYTYDFKIGDENLSYVYKEIKSDSGESTKLVLKLNGKELPFEFMPSVSDSEIGIGAMVFTKKDGKLVFSSLRDGGYEEIQSYEILGGTYKMQQGMDIGGYEGNTDLVLNKDGTGTLLGLALKYYPVKSNKIMVVSEDNDGLVIDLNVLNDTYQTARGNLATTRINIDIGDYYEIVYSNSERYFGKDLCSSYGSLYIMGDKFAFSDYIYATGKAEVSGNTAKLTITSTSSSGETHDETEEFIIDKENDGFDFEQEKLYQSGDKKIKVYKNGSVYASVAFGTGEYIALEDAVRNDVPAFYDEYADTTYVFDKELNVILRLEGSFFVDISKYNEFKHATSEEGQVDRRLYLDEEKNEIYLYNDPMTGEDAPIVSKPREQICYDGVFACADNVLYLMKDGIFFDDYISNLADFYMYDCELEVELNKYDTYEYKYKYTGSNHDLQKETVEDVYIATLKWENGKFAVLTAMLSEYDGVKNQHIGGFVGNYIGENGNITAMYNYYDLTFVRKGEGVFEMARTELSLNNPQLEDFNDGFITIKDMGMNYIYADDLLIEFVIDTPDYDGVSGNRFISQAGAQDEEFEAIYAYYGEIILDEQNKKVYIPTTNIEFDVFEYIIYSYEQIDVVDEMLISYEAEKTEYLLISNDGYYPASLGSSIPDYSQLASFTFAQRNTYSVTKDGEGYKLAIGRYSLEDQEYALIVKYQLTELEKTDSYISSADACFEIVKFGALAEVDQNTLTVAISSNEVYTITIDGENATITQNNN
ncbi:MAG: hypothetical protein J6K52_02655 [Clostridia bacterium]|nr:hypothetical protein [Clostridia bacterium]